MAGSFKMVSFNILADIHHLAFKYRTWAFRSNLLKKLLLGLNADVLCLQECDHFADSFAPTFEMQGYKGVFAPKLGKQDGNATFWKDTTFSFVSHEVMSFNDHPSGLTCNEPQTASVLCLRVVGSSKEIVVVNTHLKAPDHLEYIRELQGGILIAKLAIQFSNCAIIVAGDFNTERNSNIARYFRGELESLTVDGPDNAKAIFSKNPFCLNNVTDLKELYTDTDTPYTIYMPYRIGVIDYMWYESRHFMLKSFEKIPPVSWAAKELFLPSSFHPSDHLPVCATFSIL